ncbi:hypothetical protein H6503_03440 [Candidatus Woesearchaeota archaeon]|nr:hypothetical protein [Candidatus Woesearchaeota archaeon]
MVTREEIFNRYYDVDGLGISLEDCDLWSLDTHVKKHYMPSDNPVAVSIGACVEKASSVMRAFHKLNYDVDCRTVSIQLHAFGNHQSDRYDMVFEGPLEGDARTAYPWQHAVTALDALEGVDFVLVRNPNLFDVENWHHIYWRANDYLRKGGVIATIIRDGDLVHYENVLSSIKDRMVPLLTEELDIDMQDLMCRSHKYISLFRKD